MVKITSPADYTAMGKTPITIEGTIDDPDATVVINQQFVAKVSGGRFKIEGVGLLEGGIC